MNILMSEAIDNQCGSYCCTIPALPSDDEHFPSHQTHANMANLTQRNHQH